MSALKKDPIVLLIPGGPGLTCDSIGSLRSLSSVAKFVEVDPPMANGPISYEALMNVLLEVVQAEAAPLIAIGHSFGGILAADLATRVPERMAGLVCLTTPFSREAFESVDSQYQSLMTQEMSALWSVFETNETNDNFQNWISSYGTLYFIEKHAEAGRKMLLEARTEFQAYLGASSESPIRGPKVLEGLRSIKCEKLLLYGEHDRLVLREPSLKDAEAGDLIPVLVPEASHFVTFDNATFVNQLLTSFILNLKKENQMGVT